MAEIQTTSSSKHKGVKRLVKKSTRVDLTPMVDLGFLLITFFVFTSALSKPKVMDIITPMDSSDPTPICESCVLTVMLEKDNSISYYEGMPDENTVLQQTTFNEEGIRSILIKKREAVKQLRGTADDMVVIIKPTDESVYRNFVDILDEVAINGVKHYFIDEVNEIDKKLLSEN
jgi:biopolymer transport protein ExbD